MYLIGKTRPSPKPEPFNGSNVMPSTAAQTATTGPKRTMTMALLVALAALMGSGAMTTMTTKISDGAHPPQVVIAV